MAELHSAIMFRAKRDKIRDVIAAYGRRLNQVRADLAQVNAMLRLFDCSGEPSDVPPYLDLTRVFLRRNETGG